VFDVTTPPVTLTTIKSFSLSSPSVVVDTVAMLFAAETVPACHF
jgi:hypothetical protein